jgi:transglutaminase-like putative cysteine protease
MNRAMKCVSRPAFRTRSALFVFLSVFTLSLLVLPADLFAEAHRGVVTVGVRLAAPAGAKTVRLWVPYPKSDGNQKITDVRIAGNFTREGIYREGAFGNAILYAEWERVRGDRILSYSFRVSRKERVDNVAPAQELPFSRQEFRKELAATSVGPTGGPVKELADRLTRGKDTNLAKSRAIYDWVVDNMYRDPDTKGCGLGEVDRLLATLGGKCADIHSVYVALLRAAGVPAREVFGIRLPKDKEGDITTWQHCWAEWYRPGYGWVVADPADVRKAILERKITVEQAKPLREYYFGTVDSRRVAFGTGRDLMLNPPQATAMLNYFMYPYAEADGKPLNEDLYGFNIGYTIHYKEL